MYSSNVPSNATTPPNLMQYNHDRTCKKTPLILHNGNNIRKKHIKGNLKRINLSLNALNSNTKNLKKEKPPQTLQIVSTPQRNKFQKLIEIIGYKMSHSKLSEFFDSNCRQSVICWKCCIDETTDSITKIHKFNRQVQPYKCTHTCSDKKRYSWRKEMTANDGLYYEHNKTFKENMARIQQIYKSSTKPVMDATDTRKRKFVPPPMEKNTYRAPDKKKVKCNIDIHMEKLELEQIIKVQHMEEAKFNNICCMNEWYDSMIVLEVNYNNLTRMYRRIEKEVKNCELLGVIMQVMKRYTDSINELKLRMNLFENGWNNWNKQQIIYWIKNIEGGMFNCERYKRFLYEIGNCVLIKNGNDMLTFNDLALLLLGLESENDRDILHQNVNRLIKVCDESNLTFKSIVVKKKK
eukprot:242483_1